MRRAQQMSLAPCVEAEGAQAEPDSLSELKRHRRFQVCQGRNTDIFAGQSTGEEDGFA